MKKVAIVGPVYPYRGGISHYTGLLYRCLAEKYDVAMVSYKMQFPRFLYKSEQKDYSNDQFRIPDTQYWLNTANPFNIASTASKINDIHPDLVIIQWWHPYFAPCYFILTRLLRHTKILFVCHNVYPHQRFPMDKFLTRIALKKGDAYILHSHSDIDELKEISSHADYRVAVHPTYNAFRLTGMSRKEAREKLDIPGEEKLLLFFGFVRSYKGLKYLLQAMPEIISSRPDIHLIVAGEFGDDGDDYLEMISQLDISDSVRCYSSYIPDTEVEQYFAACDVVMLPYESATQSGIAQIAYGFERPVIATRVGGLPEVVIDGKTGLLVPPCDPSALARAVIRYFEEDKEEEYAEHIREESEKYSWNRLRETIEEFTW